MVSPHSDNTRQGPECGDVPAGAIKEGFTEEAV